MAQEDKLIGVVNAVGMERDEQEYQSFTITLGIKIKIDKKVSYTEGEKIMKQFQKDLLGKNIEMGAIAVECPICGKVYNSEQGMKQHQRLQHGDEEPPKKKRGRQKKTEPAAEPEKKKAKKPVSKKK
ncbi:C2H2-type zinc finger protein [Candidatus Bathyarchaeota archaeon]|nr:C2H2-type zinc finger protein [Candidatus Bathyarchaeota archaeon]